MSTTSSDAGARMKSVLAEGIARALELKAALVEERDALERRDTARMADAANGKERLVAELARVEESRTSIIGRAGLAGVADAMRALADDCNSAELAASWERYRGVARDCDVLNRTNGAIIQLRRRQIIDGLTLLRGEPPAAGTYSETGAAETGAGRRALTEA
jgi:flagellar biosynthesis/type III secretory pathway chaperone